jgi:LPXTG-motif cell wall-anchored protein
MLAICTILATLPGVALDVGRGSDPVPKERSVRKMTVLGAFLLLVAGLVASPAAAFAVPAGSPHQVVDLGDGYLAEAVAAAQADVATSRDDEPDELAATGSTSAIGFTLIAVALVGGGVTLTMLRRKGALGS